MGLKKFIEDLTVDRFTNTDESVVVDDEGITVNGTPSEYHWDRIVDGGNINTGKHQFTFSDYDVIYLYAHFRADPDAEGTIEATFNDDERNIYEVRYKDNTSDGSLSRLPLATVSDRSVDQYVITLKLQQFANRYVIYDTFAGGRNPGTDSKIIEAGSIDQNIGTINSLELYLPSGMEGDSPQNVEIFGRDS